MMAIFQWFDTEEIDEFARSIAAELVRRAPPAGLDARDEKTSKRLRNTHHAVFSRAEQFARTHKLNLYKKARLGNQFRWALKEDRKSTRLNSSHRCISYAVFCLKKK